MDTTGSWYAKNATLWVNAKKDPYHHEPEFIRFLEELPSYGFVLDVGCANGIHPPLFLGRGYELSYLGIDVTEAFLEVARERYPRQRFEYGDINDPTTLPLYQFDGLWCAATLMHAKDITASLGYLRHLLKPNGVAYFTLPTEHPNPDRAHDGDNRHFVILSKQEQEELFTAGQWEILYNNTKVGSKQTAYWQCYIVRRTD